MSRNWISLCSKVLERPFKVLVLARPRSINCIDLEIVLSHLSVLYSQERKKKLKKERTASPGHSKNCRKPHFAAPNPSLVFLIIAVKGSCNPPVTPIRSPSDHPIMANIRNPRLLEPSFGAAW